MDKTNTNLKKASSKKIFNNLILSIIAAIIIALGGIVYLAVTFVIPVALTVLNIICDSALGVFAFGVLIPFLGMFFIIPFIGLFMISNAVDFVAPIIHIIFAVIQIASLVIVFAAIIMSIIALVKMRKNANGEENLLTKVISIVNICLGALLILLMIIMFVLWVIWTLIQIIGTIIGIIILIVVVLIFVILLSM